MRCGALSLLILVIYLNLHFWRTQAFPSDDLALRLKLALSDPENEDSFNEISRTLNDESVNLAVVLFNTSYENQQQVTTIKNEITTTPTPTTKAPTETEAGSGSDKEQQAIRSSLRRRMLGFLSSWMQIRHLLRLTS